MSTEYNINVMYGIVLERFELEDILKSVDMEGQVYDGKQYEDGIQEFVYSLGDTVLSTRELILAKEHLAFTGYHTESENSDSYDKPGYVFNRYDSKVIVYLKNSRGYVDAKRGVGSIFNFGVTSSRNFEISADEQRALDTFCEVYGIETKPGLVVTGAFG